MTILDAPTVDHHVIAGISLASAVLGFLGSLFFTYDVLGRPGGPLRWFLRILVPTVVGASVLAGLVALVAAVGFRLPLPTVRSEVIAFAAGGAILGFFNGAFVDLSSTRAREQWRFSLRDAVVGMSVAAVSAWLYFRFGPDVLHIPSSGSALLMVVGASAIVGALAGGIWRSINRSASPTDTRPPFFSGQGVLIGGLTALALPLATFSFAFLLHPTVSSYFSVYALATFCLAAVGGGVTGGLSRSIFWWTNTLPGRLMEIIGIWLIVIAFLAQVVEPTLQLFDIAVR